MGDKYEALSSTLRQETATDEEITKARGIWQTDELEIDDGAHVSRDDEGNTGYWVAAWVWIDHQEEKCQ